MSYVPNNNVPMKQEPHSSHKMSEWEPGAYILPTGSDRFGKDRECEVCGGKDVLAGGGGSRWQDDFLSEKCL